MDIKIFLVPSSALDSTSRVCYLDSTPCSLMFPDDGDDDCDDRRLRPLLDSARLRLFEKKWLS